MKLLSNPTDSYGAWDVGMNPSLLAAQLFGETVSIHHDERYYNDEVVSYLDKNYDLVEYSSFVDYIDDMSEEDREKALVKKRLAKDEDELPFYNDKKAERLYKSRNYSYLIKQSNEEVGKNKLRWYYPASQKVDFTILKSFIVPEDKEAAKVGVLLKNSNGALVIKKIAFDCPEIDLSINYGAGFEKTHEKIADRLNNFDKGIVILKGTPGSGKSFYIKWLTTQVNRQFIFIPVNLCGALSEPDFLTLLISQCKNSVLILEDAEQAIQSRDDNLANAGAISALLQLSDGILSSICEISLILTWNTEKERIDPALLRAGRTLFTFTFGSLKIEDAQKVADKLKKNFKVSKPMTLAEIYNVEVDNNVVKEVPKRMGFGG